MSIRKKISNIFDSKSSLKYLKLDNRGESLAIVLIGILMVGILGTMILTMTATNYKVNVMDSKNQEVYYTNEKMVNEVQSYFGAEALTTANNVYTYIMKNYVITDTATSTTSSLTSTAATAMFKKYYFDGYDDIIIPTNSIKGISDKYKASAVLSTTVDKIIEDIYNYYDSEGIYSKVMDGTDVKGMKYDDFLITIKKGTDCKVIYSDSDGDGENDTITIKNLVIGCESDNGYYTSIKNDFVISSPDSILSFKDTKMPDSYDDLFTYAMVVEGTHDMSTVNGEGSLVVDKELNLDGNIYVGSDLTNSRKKSIVINPGAKLTGNSNVLYSAGPVVVKGSTASSGLLSLSGKDKTMKFWARDIVTENKDSVTSIDTYRGANISLDGEILVSDDLEINGTNSNIVFTGAYFGYGFMRPRVSTAVESYASVLNGFTTASAADIQDHETRSSMVVNERGVYANFMGLDKLIIAGRSFVDLQDGGLYDNATYMTGESVSFKGDQKLYYATADNPNLPEFLNGRNTITLTEANALASAAGEDVNTFITSRMNNGAKNVNSLGNKRYDSSYPEVIYRLYHNTADGSKNMIYFFVYDTDPRTQTKFFYDSYSSGGHSTVLTELGNLGVNYFAFDLTNTSIYTVGTLFSYDGSNLSGATYNGDNNNRTSNVPTSNTMTVNEFLKYENEIYERQHSMVPALKDIDGEIGTSSGNSKDIVRKDVYGYFVKAFTVDKSGTLTDQSDLDLEVGGSYTASTTGYVIKTITTTTNLSTILGTLKSGVVIVNVDSTTAKLNIDTDFTGCILINGNTQITDDVEIKSDEKLVKYVFGHAMVNDGASDITLGEYILDGYYATSSARSTIDPVDNTVTYTDLVKVENYEQTNE